jgi:tetratricopeptide (TPR) repeat protein
MTHTQRKLRPWAAVVIVSAFILAVAGSAAVGWWFARESPAHQGPIVLISVDGMPATALPVYGEPRTDTPAIDLLASDGVVFEHAYAQSPQTLPAHASILSGQLPLQHGVRDDAGFALKDDVQTMAEMLKNRGFATGAAVSSFLLRPETGVAQGFRFYDAELPASATVNEEPVLARSASDTLDAAETWVRMQDGRRFFLLVQVDQRDADTAVTRLTALLKSRALYDGATIVLLGSRGEEPSQTLDDAAIRVPLIVKQPGSEGAGRRVDAAVQQIDLLPTLLDLVRAPVPGALTGRSLRAVLTDKDATLRDRPLYAEWLSPHFGFGGHAIYALTTGVYRYVRGTDEELTPLASAPADPSGTATDTARLRDALDRLTGASAPVSPARIAPADEERFALLGYLPPPHLTIAPPPLSARDQAALISQHRAAALLIGQKKYSAGIRALQAIVNAHPELVVVQYQLASALTRAGRLDEAIGVLQDARDHAPDEADLALALADALMRAGRIEQSADQAEAAVMLAKVGDASTLAAAHELAARIALARNDVVAATAQAKAAREADPALPIEPFVRGRVLYDDGKYEEAAAAFQEAATMARAQKRSVPDLYLYLGESLAHLERFSEAEAQYREELRTFPQSVHVYSRLAMLYAATNRQEAVEDVLNELVAATPTPESYAVAARLWTIVGNRSRAEALRSDARSRFRGDPSLALLGKDGRR